LLEPIIGTKLYDKLLADTENAVLHSDYQDLLVNKVWPYLSHATVYKIALNLIYRITNSSVVKNTNENSTAIALQELNVMRQEREAGMKYTQQKLINYLENNTAKFPEYLEYDIEGLPASPVNQPRNFYADDESYVSEEQLRANGWVYPQ